jgi:hypothetical protein
MYNFSCRIAAAEKFPSLAFSFKSLDPTVLEYHPSMPECVKLATGRVVYSVALILIFVSHDVLFR